MSWHQLPTEATGGVLPAFAPYVTPLATQPYTSARRAKTLTSPRVRKEESTSKKQDVVEGRKYLSGKHAAEKAHVDPRTIYRWIERGLLHAHHDTTTNKLQIAVDDLEAFLAQRPQQDDSEEQLTHDIASLKAQVQELLPLKAHVHSLQKQVDHLLAILTASVTNQNLEETPDAGQTRTPFLLAEAVHVLSQLRSTRSGVARSLSILERRGLPLGTMTVSDFAKLHRIKVHTIKKLCTDGHITLSLIPRREHALRNKLEWWMKPQEQAALIGFWQAHGIAFTTCPQCPHEAHAEAQAG